VRPTARVSFSSAATRSRPRTATPSPVSDPLSQVSMSRIVLRALIWASQPCSRSWPMPFLSIEASPS
jgi:hypothetical protein